MEVSIANGGEEGSLSLWEAWMARVEGWGGGDGPAAALLCEAQMKSSWQIVSNHCLLN